MCLGRLSPAVAEAVAGRLQRLRQKVCCLVAPISSWSHRWLNRRTCFRNWWWNLLLWRLSYRMFGRSVFRSETPTVFPVLCRQALARVVELAPAMAPAWERVEGREPALAKEE